VTAAITAGAKRSYHAVRNPDSLVTIENLKALKISDEGARRIVASLVSANYARGQQWRGGAHSKSRRRAHI
jgi:hypothetical protein